MTTPGPRGLFGRTPSPRHITPGVTLVSPLGWAQRSDRHNAEVRGSSPRRPTTPKRARRLPCGRVGRARPDRRSLLSQEDAKRSGRERCQMPKAVLARRLEGRGSVFAPDGRRQPDAVLPRRAISSTGRKGRRLAADPSFSRRDRAGRGRRNQSSRARRQPHTRRPCGPR